MRRTWLACILSAAVAGLACAAEKGLVAHYPMEAGQGDVLADKSGNGNDGKIQGPTWVTGEFGTALEFDGVDDIVDCGAKPVLDTKAGTIEVWVRPKERAQGGIVGRNTGIGWEDNRCVLAFNTYSKEDPEGHRTVFVVADGNKDVRNYAIAEVPLAPADEWTHFVGVFDEKMSRLYVNGKEAAEKAKDFAPVMEGAPLKLGHNLGLGPAFFRGTMDEVRIYNRALTAEEIAAHYKAQMKGRRAE